MYTFFNKSKTTLYFFKFIKIVVLFEIFLDSFKEQWSNFKIAILKAVFVDLIFFGIYTCCIHSNVLLILQDDGFFNTKKCTTRIDIVLFSFTQRFVKNLPFRVIKLRFSFCWTKGVVPYEKTISLIRHKEFPSLKFP